MSIILAFHKMKEPIIISGQIKLLMSKHLSESLNPEEIKVLKLWIEESPDHKEYFNEIRNTWILAGKQHHNIKEKNLLEMVDRVSRSNHKLHRNFWTWQRIAASWVILFIGAGMLGWFMRDEQAAVAKPAELTSTTVQVKMGSQSTVDLPDGTQVWLNGGSRIPYNSEYGEQNREVQLTGEGYFEVVTNPEKPFVVKTGGLSIKAYGTTFNVKAYPEDGTITTTLVKGKVAIEGKDENDKMFSLEMKPNENVTYKIDRNIKKEQLPIKSRDVSPSDNRIPDPVAIENNIKPELYTSWKEDLWVIEKQKLGNLSKDFERRYNVCFVFSSNKVMDYHFSGTIQRETIEQVMKILRRTIPLKYSFDKNLITIDEDKALIKEFYGNK